MTARKRKKNTRQRGSKTHGWGAMKKHRGAGNRGGRGRAGTGKRADAKKPSFEKKRYFGKHGFKKRRTKREVRAISLGKIDEMTETWVERGLAKKEGEVYSVDLHRIGYDKVLSNGSITKKVKIKAINASKTAVEKAKKAGCVIELLVTKEKEAEKKEQDVKV